MRQLKRGDELSVGDVILYGKVVEVEDHPNENKCRILVENAGWFGVPRHAVFVLDPGSTTVPETLGETLGVIYLEGS